MNKNRLDIFQFLCRVPGSSLNKLSRQFGFSLSTVKWHLEKLKMGKYVIETNIGNKVAYFPNGIAEPRFMEVLSILNEELPMLVFWTLLKNQGSTQKALCEILEVKVQPLRLAIKKLEHLNLILSVIDGRYRRYYPTDELYLLANKNRKKTRQFRNGLLKRLEEELLNPKIHISKSGERLIEIDVGSSKEHIFIPSDLSTSVLTHYRETREESEERTA
jgi:predicted transcriptional regulator